MRRLAWALILLSHGAPAQAAAGLCEEALGAAKAADNSAGEKLVKEVLDAYTPNPDDFDFGIVATANPLIRNNAAADTCPDGRRYIFYDPAFVASAVKADGTKDWPRYALFAHEVGHHVLNHFLSGIRNTSAADQKRFELAADRVAGFTLAELGASVPDALASIVFIADPEETATHPGLCDRRRAFMEGFNKAAARLSKPVYSLENDACVPAAIGPGGIRLPFVFTPGVSTSAQWKDRAEYDLYQSITHAQSPGQKLSLLDQWTERYPATAFKMYRNRFYLEAFFASNNIEQVIDLAISMLAEQPGDVAALVYLVYLGPSSKRSPGAWLTSLDSAAQSLALAFSSSVPPPGASLPAWQKSVPTMQAAASRARGWVAMTRGNCQDAISYFRQSLEKNGQDAYVSYLLGSCIFKVKDRAAYPLALYEFARAVVYRGPGELEEAARKVADDYLPRAYGAYRGSGEGLSDLKTFALQSPLPPEGFNLASVADIFAARAAERDELRKKDPQLALWLDVRDYLLGPDGEKYFESSVKDTDFPKLHARIVRTTGSDIIAGISDAATEEVILHVNRYRPQIGHPGDLIEFKGIPASFNKNPFRVFFDVEPADIKVLAR
jgi:hypothetical protein